ncbi:hypothetical protein DFS34DRAFT_582205 [Phlyctochytrium arcticum]|nr:hypothetical protein DFS34DRAFT_582205 [Phlyctochytrium arcticum]
MSSKRKARGKSSEPDRKRSRPASLEEEEEILDPAWPRTVQAGTGKVLVDKMVETLWPTSSEELRQTFKKNGYLLIRQAIPRSQVESARSVILGDMLSTGFLDDDTYLDACISSTADGDGPKLLNRQDLAQRAELNSVLEHETLQGIFEDLFHECREDQEPLQEPEQTGLGRRNNDPILVPKRQQKPPNTCSCSDPAGQTTVRPLPYKWLRAVGPNLNTGPHIDRVYFAKIPSIITAWVPLGDNATTLGSIIVASGSHQSPHFAKFRQVYGSTTVGKDGTHSGWVSQDPADIDVKFGLEIEWKSADVRMGDVVVLDKDLLHMSSNNVCRPPTYRLSCDVRWVCI